MGKTNLQTIRKRDLFLSAVKMCLYATKPELFFLAYSSFGISAFEKTKRRIRKNRLFGLKRKGQKLFLKLIKPMRKLIFHNCGFFFRVFILRKTYCNFAF